MRSVVAMTWKFVRRNWYWYLLAAALFDAALIYSDRHGGHALGAALIVPIAYTCWPVYRAFLGDTYNAQLKTDPHRARPGRRYFWAATLIFFILPLPTVLIVIAVLDASDHSLLTWLTSPAHLGLFSIAVTTFTVLLVLPLFGTAIPAAVAGDKAGPKAALVRARRTFWTVLWRLIAGPGLLGGVVFGALLVLAGLFNTIILLAEKVFQSNSTVFAIMEIAIHVIDIEAVVLGFMSVSTLVIAVLCRAYLDTAVPPDQPPFHSAVA